MQISILAAGEAEFFGVLLAIGSLLMLVGLWERSKERNQILKEKLGGIEAALKEIAASVKQPK